MSLSDDNLPQGLARQPEDQLLAGWTSVFRREMAWWWGSPRTAVSASGWLGTIGGFLAVVLVVSYRQVAGATTVVTAYATVPLLTALVGFLLPIGAIIAAHDAVVGEIGSGTAGWVVSKPVSREAFMLAKISAHGVQVLATMIALPTLVSYIQLSWVAKQALPVVAYVGAWTLLYLNLVFYMTLGIAAGAVFRNRACAIAVPLGLLLVTELGSSVGIFSRVMPWRLPEIAAALAMGEGVPDPLPVAFTTIWIGAWAASAVWAFKRSEL